MSHPSQAGRWTLSAACARIAAITSRYWYLFRGSWPRVIELAYWPTLNVVTWGFTSRFLEHDSSWLGNAAGIMVSAVLLWDIMFRGQLGVSVSFLEELWSRNLAHIFISPLRPGEWVVSLMLMSVIRLLIGIVPAVLVAALLYHYSIFDLGFALIPYVLNLIVMGWWLGLIIIGLILRWGMGAEGLAWMAVFILMPISAVFYPVSTLPEWLRAVSLCLPSTYVFEGMRSVLQGHGFRFDLLWPAIVLNGVGMAGAYAGFRWFLAAARRDGRLMSMGE